MMGRHDVFMNGIKKKVTWQSGAQYRSTACINGQSLSTFLDEKSWNRPLCYIARAEQRHSESWTAQRRYISYLMKKKELYLNFGGKRCVTCVLIRSLKMDCACLYHLRNLLLACVIVYIIWGIYCWLVLLFISSKESIVGLYYCLYHLRNLLLACAIVYIIWGIYCLLVLLFISSEESIVGLCYCLYHLRNLLLACATAT